MDWILGASVALNAVLVAFGIYFRKAIEAYVDFRKTKAMEEFKKELDERYVRRYKAEKIGELLALLIGKQDDFVAINKIIFEMALAMPRDLVVCMSSALKSRNDEEVLTFFLEVRSHLGITDGLEPKEVIYYVPGKPRPARPPAPQQS